MKIVLMNEIFEEGGNTLFLDAPTIPYYPLHVLDFDCVWDFFLPQGFSLCLVLGGFLPERLSLTTGFLFLFDVTTVKGSPSVSESPSS